MAVVGVSDAGKTTLVEKLVAELKGRGYRVGTVKHDVHGFEVDKEGKDSWRHKQAGAWATAVSSPEKLFLVRDGERDLPLDEVAAEFFGKADVVVAEGYKSGPSAKIEVHRRETGRELLTKPEEGLLAVATDEPLDVPVPSFGLDDSKGLGDLIEEKLIKKRKTNATLWVNGKPVPMKPFVQDFIIGGVLGMAGSLEGVEPGKVKTLELKID